MRGKTEHNNGFMCVIAAAVLFGLSAPLIKIMGAKIDPVFLAGFLYLGSGTGLSLAGILKSKSQGGKEAKLRGRDFLWLAGAVLCGGVAAPILLTVGLVKAPASTASLFLNAECILTAVVAFLIFKEPIGGKIWLAVLAMTAGGIFLSIDFTTMKISFPPSLLLITGACLMWAVDNNLTRPLSDRDPFEIARLKGLAAGTVSIIIAILTGEKIPDAASVAGAMITGAFCYGASLVLFIYALRYMGTARSGASFAAAPFIGAVFSIILLKEPVTLNFLISFVFIAAGIWFLLKEEHTHSHEHEPLNHNHIHSHDEHHYHKHAESVSSGERHSHSHIHEPIIHSHVHLPDVHHRHAHE